MENIEQKKNRKTGKRSPEYPLLSLQEAIEKTKILWDKDKNNNIPSEAAYTHLGYETIGGYAARIMSSLKKYDLIFENKGVIKLSEDAVDLALHDPESEHYMNIVKKLALKPTIYARIIEDNNGTIPSDTTLKVKLIKDYEFNPDKVERFITTFRKTMEFAGLTGDNAMQRTITGTVEARLPTIELQARATNSSPSNRDAAMKGTIFPIPLSRRKQAAIAFETLPVEKKDIEAIRGWLNLFEESLTEDNDN